MALKVLPRESVVIHSIVSPPFGGHDANIGRNAPVARLEGGTAVDPCPTNAGTLFDGEQAQSGPYSPKEVDVRRQRAETLGSA